MRRNKNIKSHKKNVAFLNVLSKYGTFLYGLACLSVTLYLTGISLYHYLENSDTSVMSTRTFNERPEDVYPTYTLCLVDDRAETESYAHDGIFHGGYIASKKGVYWPHNYGGRKSWHKYRSFLEGNAKFTRKERQLMSDIDFVLATHPLTRFMRRMEVAERFEKDLESDRVRLSQEITSIEGNNRQNRSTFESMLYLSYQSPNELCYTRTSTNASNYKKLHETLIFSAEDIYNKAFSDIFLYFHHPGQFHRGKIQALRINVYYGTNNLYYYNRNHYLEIITTGVFRKRADAIEKCNTKIDSDDDKQWIKGAVEILKCIPPFWKAFYEWKNSTFSTCKTPEQFQMVTRVVQRDKEEAGYTHPCAEMSIGVVKSEFEDNLLLSQKQGMTGLGNRKMGNLNIIVKYPKSTYHEILNRREITFDIFWSTTGGFVGMFLGYSAMQLPEFIFGALKWSMNQ